jgi:rhodanese-related sulfurtransferase
MRKFSVWCITTLVTFLFAGACAGISGSDQAQGASRMLEAKDAYALVEKNKGNANFVVLDVRTPDEFSEGHIAGAVNVNYNSNQFRGELMNLDKKKTYLVYCRTGRRSADAVRIMKEMGFTDLLRFNGDIVKWKSEKLPLVK